jgi:aspartyl-tRNA(Asn)/glutamyl-tRNA(Gln) amidotransferase subunit A
MEIHEVSLPHTKYGLPVYYLLLFAEASANLARMDGTRFGLSVSEGAKDVIDIYLKLATKASGMKSSAGSCLARTLSLLDITTRIT